MSKLFNFGLILLLILSTALFTLFPKNFLIFLSLSSCASKAPVDAPEGDIADADIPFSKIISASTVGFLYYQRLVCLLHFYFCHLYFTKLSIRQYF